jgi:hypothetical protein
MRQVKASVPAEQLGPDPQAAVALVNELTDRALKPRAWRRNCRPAQFKLAPN